MAMFFKRETEITNDHMSLLLFHLKLFLSIWFIDVCECLKYLNMNFKKLNSQTRLKRTAWDRPFMFVITGFVTAGIIIKICLL